jgi:hypothetical protein
MPNLPQEVKWGEDLDLDKAPTLSEEELHILKQRQAVMDKLLKEKQRAKYKIELFFGSQYKTNQHYPGAVSLWLSGSKLHGGGDEKIYLCPKCGGFILPSAQGYGHLVCSKCGQVAKGKDAIGEILLRLTTQHWAAVIYSWFRKMEFNADIYVKRPRMDLRTAATLEQARQMGGEKLMAARAKREVFIYPLYNIIKDTAGGADLPTRFKALLSA